MNDNRFITRRRFLATGGALVAGAAIPSAMRANASDSITVERRELRIPGLPPEFEGFRVAQVSDVHLYDGVHGAAAAALAAIRADSPDLVVVTGDMWDTPAGASASGEWLRELAAAAPTLAILGNHDYHHLPAGTRPRSAYDSGRVPLLVNDVTVLERRGAKLAIVGLDDMRSGTPDVAKVARQIPDGAVECWLIHEPGMYQRMRWPEHPAPRFALSGHTHGGQVRFPGVPALTPRGSGSYVAGSYEVQGVQAYVSRGVGTSGVRFRVACPAELPIFTLVPGADL